MRFAKKLDKFLWFALMIMPIAITVVGQFNNSVDFSQLITSLSSIGVLTPLKNALDNVGIVFSPCVYMFAWWVAQVTLMHILIDVLLLAPKMCDRLIKSFSRYEE